MKNNEDFISDEEITKQMQLAKSKIGKMVDNLGNVLKENDPDAADELAAELHKNHADQGEKKDDFVSIEDVIQRIKETRENVKSALERLDEQMKYFGATDIADLYRIYKERGMK